MGAAFGAGSQIEQNTRDRDQHLQTQGPSGYISATGFTPNGAEYAPIAGANGVQRGDPWAVDSNVGSDEYLRDIYRQRMYETGGGTTAVDPSRFWYGGGQQFGQNVYNQAQTSAAAMGIRQAPAYQQFGPVDPNFALPQMGAYNMGLAAQGNARNQQQFMLGAQGQDLAGIRALAQGQGTSAAELAMGRQSDQAMRQNLAMAATGRGAGANALRMGALQNNAMQQGQLVRDLGIQRAQEQQGWAGMLMQGNQAMTDAYGNIRSSDLGMADMAGRMDLDASQQYFDAGLASQDQMINQAQYSSDAQLQQQQANDAMVQFYLNQGMSVQQAMLQANIQMETLRSNNILQQRQIEAGMPADSSMATQILGAGIEAGGYAAGSYFGGPAGAAAGGAVGGTVNREMNS